MSKPVFRVRVIKHSKDDPLIFSFYMDQREKAIALVKAFEGDKDYTAAADLNATRVVFDDVLEAYQLITETRNS